METYFVLTFDLSGLALLSSGHGFPPFCASVRRREVIEQLVLEHGWISGRRYPHDLHFDIL